MYLAIEDFYFTITIKHLVISNEERGEILCERKAGYAYRRPACSLRFLTVVRNDIGFYSIAKHVIDNAISFIINSLAQQL